MIDAIFISLCIAAGLLVANAVLLALNWRRHLNLRRGAARKPPPMKLSTGPVELVCLQCGLASKFAFEIEGPFDGTPDPQPPLNVPPGARVGFEIGARFDPSKPRSKLH
jgi:hypothetical protein